MVGKIHVSVIDHRLVSVYRNVRRAEDMIDHVLIEVILSALVTRISVSGNLVYSIARRLGGIEGVNES